MSNDIRSESRVQSQQKVSASIKSVRMRLDALQWGIDWALREGYELEGALKASEEMRSWASELMDAADGLEASLNVS